MILNTPYGPLWMSFDTQGALTELKFGHPTGPHPGENQAAARQLTEYFAGIRTEFDLPLAPQGTPFQKKVWEELTRIPFGATVSYSELAKRVGSEGAARAVGRANATNPIAIVVPCHRVIGADGSLTGYAYGVDLKRNLLALEGTATC